MDPDFACAVDELPAARAGRLIAHEEHRVPLIGQRRRQVVQDASAGRHAAGRDHDAGRRLAVSSFDCCGEATSGSVWSRTRTPDPTSAATPDRAPRHVPSSTSAPRSAIGLSTYTGSTGMRCSASEPAHPVEQLLDTSDREGRNHQLAASRGGALDDVRQRLRRIVRSVIAVAVGRFDEHDISRDRVDGSGRIGRL